MISSNLIEIQKSLLEGSLTVVELVKQYLNSEKESRHCNAYVEVFATSALEKALELDHKIKANPDRLGSLFGAVVSVKDNICYKGHRASAGSKMLEDYVSPFIATVVQRLVDADAIIIGRTNCDEFSMGSTSESSIYGPVKNAIDQTKVAGGSSGGAAVAVKNNTCLVALGSDTGGSIRQPASFNGVIGYKPSFGLVSRWGLIAYGSSFDVIGLLGTSYKSLAMVMNVISGPDNYDSTAIQEPRARFDWDELDLSSVKIAYLSNMVDHDKLQPEAKEGFLSFVNTVSSKGACITAESFDFTDFLVPAYYILCTAEASSNLSRYDGVRFGHRSDRVFDDYKDMIKQSRNEGFGKEVKKRIILGNFVLSEGYFDAYYKKALKVRGMIKESVNQLLERYDFIILPTTTSEAWSLGYSSKDPIEMYLSDMYTVLANLCGIPAVSIPLTKTVSGLPLGVQVMTKFEEDHRLFDFMASMDVNVNLG